MSEVLLLRVDPRASSRLYWWQVQPASGVICAQGESSSLADLANEQPNMRALPLWLLLPGQWFSVCACRLPPGRGRQLARLLPALLEDELAQDIDELHFALLQRENDHGHVAVIERSVLRHWYDDALMSGFNLQALWPDWLALPAPSSTSPSMVNVPSTSMILTVLNSEQGVLARRYDRQNSQDWQGGSVEPLLTLPLLTALCTAPVSSALLSTESHEVTLASSAIISPVASTVSEVETITIWYGIPPTPAQIAALAARLPSTSIVAVNSLEPGSPSVDDTEGALLLRGVTALQQQQSHGVLGGEFAPRNVQAGQWRQWRSLAAALALLALLLLGEQGVRWWQLTREADQAASQAEQAYRTLFPQQTRRVNMRAQLNAVLRQMRGQPPLQGLVPYLRKVALALQDPQLSRQPLQVKSLQYLRDQQSLRLQVQAAGFAELDQLRSILGRDFEVEQGALSRDGAGVAGSLLLRERVGQPESAVTER